MIVDPEAEPDWSSEALVRVLLRVLGVVFEETRAAILDGIGETWQDRPFAFH